MASCDAGVHRHRAPSTNEEMTSMKPVALQLYTVRELCAEDFPGTVRKVAETGYKAVEFAGLHDMSPADVKAMVDDLGLEVCSAHTAMPNAENAEALIEEAKTIGNPRLISGFGGDDLKTVDDCKRAADKLNAAVEAIAGSGLAFGIHNHWWEFQEVEGQLPHDILLAEAPGVFAEIDVYWAQFGGCDAAEQVARKKDRAPVLHIKDGPLIEGQPQPHTAVGAGKMDIPAVINAADPDVLQYLIVELDSCATDMMQAVIDSYKYLVGNGLASGNV
jgi:sugar phosphate isomerase/epimerase